jgi:hypothetical protein
VTTDTANAHASVDVSVTRCHAIGPHVVQVVLSVVCPSVDAATLAGHLVAELTRRNADLVAMARAAVRETVSEESPHEP